jgi:hypothetical protein
MLSQLKNIFFSRIGIAVSSTFGGIFLVGIIQNFKTIGFEIFINTLLLIILIVIAGLILYNVLKIVKEKIKTKPSDKRADEKIKSNLSESLNLALNYFKPEKLDQKTWVFIFDKSGWVLSNSYKVLDTDNPYNPYLIEEGKVRCVLNVTKHFVFIEILKFSYSEDWQIFFNEIAFYRKTLPIDSIIVSVPVSTLTNNTDHNNLVKEAKDLKEQLSQLSKAILSAPPIYVVLSEMESMYGFSAFIDTMIDKSEKADQIFGWNNPISQFDDDALKEGFDHISKTLKEWGKHGQLKVNDTDIGFKLYAFQEKIQNLADNAVTFFKHIFKIDFKGGRWRGFYFLGNKSEKTYFFKNFYKKVFKERHLVSPSDDAVKNEKIKLFMFFLSVALIVLIASFLIKDYRKFRDQTQNFNMTLQSEVRQVITQSNLSIPHNARDTLNAFTRMQRIVENNLWIDFDVQNDLEMIRDSYCAKALFLPVILQVSSSLQGFTLPQRKESLIHALEQGLLIMAGMPLSLIDADPFTKHLPQSKAAIAKNIWKDCATEFYLPQSEYKHLAYNLRLGLGNLYNYWMNDSQQIGDQGPDQGNITVRFYQDSLEKLADKHNDIHVILVEIQTLRSKLSNIKNKPMPSKLKPVCQKDYSSLLKSDAHTEDYQPNVLLANLRKTIERHQEICETLDNRSQTQSNTYDHIWDKNGDVTEELKGVIAILEKTKYFYDQFFDALNDQGLQSSDVEKWRNKKLSAENQLKDLLEKIVSPGWEQNKLQQSLLYWLEKLNQDLYNHILEIIRRDQFSDNKPSPKTNRPISKVAQDKEYKKKAAYYSLQDWSPEHLLNDQQEFIQNMETIGATLNEKDKRSMANDYKKLIFHWWNQLDTFDPISSILTAQTWSEFKDQIGRIRGKFIDVNQAPLKIFLSNVSQEKLQQLKIQYADFQFDDDTLSKEKEIIDFANIFNNPVFLNLLEKAQQAFYEQVDAMDIDDPQAPKNQLTLFSQFIDNCGIPQSQLHSAVINLSKIESRCIDLFKGTTKDYLRNRFDAFVDKWRYYFDQYPFIQSIASERSERMYYPYPSETLTVFTASLKEMHHFFFDENIGLISIFPKYGIYFEEILTDAEMKLLKNCAQWQNFLFNLQDKSTKQHPLKLLLDTQTIKQNSTKVNEPFTKILIPKLFDKQSFSIDEHNRTMTTHWEHDLVNIITIHAFHESQKRVVITEKGWISSSIKEQFEPVTKQSKLIIKGGDLFLIAYTKKFSEKGCQNLFDGKTRCTIRMDLPKFDKNSKKYMPIAFLVEWGELIPDNIYWP